MRHASILIGVVLLALCVSGVATARGPEKNPKALELVGTCSDGSSYEAFTPPGRSVIDTLSTSVQVTGQLTLSDPLNEVGGSFSGATQALPALSAAGLLTTCTGTVVGTTAVTFSAGVLKTAPTP